MAGGKIAWIYFENPWRTNRPEVVFADDFLCVEWGVKALVNKL
jgi:hypothetical protein